MLLSFLGPKSNARDSSSKFPNELYFQVAGTLHALKSTPTPHIHHAQCIPGVTHPSELHL